VVVEQDHQGVVTVALVMEQQILVVVLVAVEQHQL
jgi:hypothetical protein